MLQLGEFAACKSYIKVFPALKREKSSHSLDLSLLKRCVRLANVPGDSSEGAHDVDRDVLQVGLGTVDVGLEEMAEALNNVPRILPQKYSMHEVHRDVEGSQVRQVFEAHSRVEPVRYVDCQTP